jgi:CubicO group peptidase (beta-lactamase class C family)
MLKATGLPNFELNVAATGETVYRIGSVSRQFIATGIMLLERGPP